MTIFAWILIACILASNAPPAWQISTLILWGFECLCGAVVVSRKMAEEK